MKFLDEIKNLNLPEKQYAIFGSGPIGIRNLREVNDIDLIVKENLWNELAKKYPVKSGKESIQIGNIEIFRSWSPWFEDINPLIDTAEIIKGFPFVRLAYLIKWKKSMGREKDLKDLELIKSVIKSLF